MLKNDKETSNSQITVWNMAFFIKTKTIPPVIMSFHFLLFDGFEDAYNVFWLDPFTTPSLPVPSISSHHNFLQILCMLLLNH